MFVEIIYGIWSNSLGLLTDGAHMLLDCSAILIGIYSCYLVEKPKTKHLNYGYKRSEVLGTFVNSVFLIFIALYIVFESFARFFNPQEIISDHLIMVSFLGLLVNMVGIFALHDFSSGTCSHSHSHGSSGNDHNHELKSNKDDIEKGQQNIHNHNHEIDTESNHNHSHDNNKDHGHSHDNKTHDLSHSQNSGKNY